MISSKAASRTSLREQSTSWIASVDPDHRDVTAELVRPLGDLLDVEHGVAAGRLLGPRLRHRADGRAQREHGGADVDAAVHRAVSDPDRAQPAGADREALRGFHARSKSHSPRRSRCKVSAYTPVTVRGTTAYGRRWPSWLIASVPAVRRKNEPCRSSHGLLSTNASATGRPSACRSAGPQRRDQPAGGVPADHDPVVAVRSRMTRDRRVELGVVLREVAAEVRRLVRKQRPAVLAQVERVEVVAERGEELGRRRLEEVVAEAVHVQHGARARPGRRPGSWTSVATTGALVVVRERRSSRGCTALRGRLSSTRASRNGRPCAQSAACPADQC